MNKTVNINISGLIFSIEEAAYDKLRSYLDLLKSHLKNTESGDEIYNDIELRIAELFQEKTSDTRQVIDMEDLEAIINQIGRPEDYIESDETHEESTDDDAEFVEAETIEGSSTKKRFFRDTRNKWIAGVCSGIAAYFNIPIFLVRIIMIALAVLSSGTAIIFYLVLWFVIPEAITTADFLSMNGKEVNFKNIKKEFKGHAKHHKKEAGKNIKQGNDKFKNFITKFFRVVARVGGIILVVSSSIWITTALLGFYSDISVIDSQGSDFGISFYELSSLFTEDSSHQTWAWTGMHLFIFTPLVIFFLLGVQLIVLKSIKGIKYVYIFLGVVFISGIIMSASSGVKFARTIAYEGEVSEVIDLDSNDSIVQLHLLENDVFSNKLEQNHLIFPNAFSIGDEKVTFGNPELLILPSEDSLFRISVVKRSQGKTSKIAEELADNIDFDYHVDSNGIHIGSIYQINKDDKIRIQYVKIIIYVPEGKSLKLDDRIDNMLNWHRSDALDYYVESYNNQTITLNNGSFDCENCIPVKKKRRKRHIKISTNHIDDYIESNLEEIVELEID